MIISVNRNYHIMRPVESCWWGERTPPDLGSEQSEQFRQCWSGTTEWSLRWKFGQNRALLLALDHFITDLEPKSPSVAEDKNQHSQKPSIYRRQAGARFTIARTRIRLSRYSTMATIITKASGLCLEYYSGGPSPCYRSADKGR